MSAVRSLAAAMLVYTAATATPCAAQRDTVSLDSTKVATIHRLLEITKAPAMVETGFELGIATQRGNYPNLPPAFWDALAARAHATIPQLVDSLLPVYARHLTQTELEQLIQFYSTPIGQRLIEVQPLVAKESAEVGQRWGRVLGQEIADSLSHAHTP
jgi:hypothetical protein